MPHATIFRILDRWLTDERGQTAAEYLGLLLVVSMIIAAIVSSGLDAQISEAIKRQVCSVAGGADCASNDERPTASHPESNMPAATARAAQSEFARAAATVAGLVQTRPVASPSKDAHRSPDRAGLSVALQRERLQGLPLITVGLTQRQERQLLLRRALARAEGRPIPTPTTLDRNADGIEDVIVDDKQREGDAGDRFAGEACGFARTFGAGKIGCSLGGDKSTTGFQTGEKLAGAAAIFFPTPGGKIAAVRKVVGAGKLLTDGERVGIVREAFQRKGLYTLGRGTAKEANELGRDFVRPGFRRSRRNPDVLTSKDGLRVYRPPSYKPRLGRTQANFE